MDPTSSRTTARLYKSRTNRMIDGVCGGIAEYFGIDPTLVRIVWVLVTLSGGVGFFLYIAAMIIMPTNPEFELRPSSAPGAEAPPAPSDHKRFWGIILVLIGAFLLLINLGWLADLPWWSFSRRLLLPVLLIGIGGILVLTYTRRRSAATEQAGGATAGAPAVRELRKSKTEKKLFGVCGGLANYFELDPTIVRIIFVILVLVSFGWALLLYIIMGIVMPEEKSTAALP